MSRGSQWRRWEPHIHAPGTILNNQFGDSWEKYLGAIESTFPKIQALAITDYYVTDIYEEAVRHKSAGRLPDVELIFPNVELRLDAAAKTGFVNAHLLVSPEDSDHLHQLHRILGRLEFRAFGDVFNCKKEDLIRLGRKADPSISSDTAALRHGATQFKVSFSELRDVYAASEWAKKNILIAVAGAAGDGTSGLRQASDATIRQEIESFAHVIFSSSQTQREFWLGQKNVSLNELRTRYNGCKPCLHGSDAHDIKSVGNPADDRYTWIKGELQFDALRQACIDPDGRAFVGPEAPNSALPSQVIANVTLTNTDWAKTPEILLNPGLVAIVGARGSGKTALADIIAAGCDAIIHSESGAGNTSPSFLKRAKLLLGSAQVKLTWGGGGITERRLDGRNADPHLAFPRARYLSQQFVEDLCSSNGMSDGLVDEIERVILEAHSIDERDGAVTFEELREIRTSRYTQARNRETEAISDISERIALEFEKEASVQLLATQVEQKDTLIKNYNADLAKLILKGSPEEIKRHAEVSTAVQTVKTLIQSLASQRRTFVALQDEVNSTRASKAPELLRQAQERHAQSGLTAAQWDEFLLIYKGNVDASLKRYIDWADKEIEKLTGATALSAEGTTPVLPIGADLTGYSLTVLSAELARLGALVSADALVRKQYAALSQRIAQENSALKSFNERLIEARGAEARRRQLQAERDIAYQRVFDAIVSEQRSLEELYAPLMNRLQASSGTLGKLSFIVRRVVDTNQWAEFAEEQLLDRRKAGPFNGRGSLTTLAEQMLQPVWEHETPVKIKEAMAGFISQYSKDMLLHAPFPSSQQTDFRAWSKKFAHWLFGTEHISVHYEVMYDGIDIGKLSPGTRGIVLLLLYLSLDETDDRPLIIDQPEENLDPKSVFDELVPLFIAAKNRRQVIIVTHNANLVINTDADQIILAESGPHQTGGLPPITYRAGGLENGSIRKAVCDILEGGEAAFRERARRLRVRLER